MLKITFLAIAKNYYSARKSNHDVGVYASETKFDNFTYNVDNNKKNVQKCCRTLFVSITWHIIIKSLIIIMYAILCAYQFHHI